MALSKLSVVLGGTGTLGAGGLGLVGWHMLSTEGTTSPTNYAINDISLKDNSNGITFSEYGCFKSLFKDVNFVTTEESVGSDTESLNKDNLVKSTSSDETVTFPNPAGCVVMKMSSDVNKLKWTLAGEVVIRNDKSALALWFEGFGKLTDEENSSQYSDFQQQLSYRIIFLEKSSDEKWEVKTGYSWGDSGLYHSENPSLKIFVSSPEKEWISENKDSNAIQDLIDTRENKNNNPKNNFYSGVWEYTGDSQDKEFLSEIKVGEEQGKEEVLGRSGDFSGVKLKYEEGKFYKPETKKWVKQASSELDISENLNAWFKPFKQKGKWKPLSEYCSSNSSADRNICKSAQRR